MTACAYETPWIKEDLSDTDWVHSLGNAPKYVTLHFHRSGEVHVLYHGPVNRCPYVSINTETGTLLWGVICEDLESPRSEQLAVKVALYMENKAPVAADREEGKDDDGPDEPDAWMWVMRVDDPSRGRVTMEFPSLHDTEDGIAREVEGRWGAKIDKILHKMPLWEGREP